jgi:hypothetical protein
MTFLQKTTIIQTGKPFKKLKEMKYFINATIIDPTLGKVKQKLEYDVNFDASPTVESAKTELLKRVVVPKGYELSKETIEIRGKKRDLAFVIEDKMHVIYTANLQEIPKEKK